ncbi:MAG: hypothetical protein U5L05_01180 [Rubrivivax sp.]|nr:hypothetical protein [Rubrivivax sp.]
MSIANTFETTRRSTNVSRGSGIVMRILPAAIALLAACGMLATAAFDRYADVAEAPRLLPAPPAAPVAVATGDPSLPDASVVFAGREIEVEEPAPTF